MYHADDVKNAYAHARSARTGLSGDKFRFDKNGDGPARYNIIHFKQASPGRYKWVRVGEYMEGELRLNMSGKSVDRRSTGREGKGGEGMGLETVAIPVVYVLQKYNSG